MQPLSEIDFRVVLIIMKEQKDITWDVLFLIVSIIPVSGAGACE